MKKEAKELKLGLPKGSLQSATIELFKRSGWKISGMERSYFPSIDDKQLRCSVVRAQEMSRYVESGSLDAGITGKDWIEENASDVRLVAELVYAKTSFRPVRWILAVPQDSAVKKIEDLKGKRIATEIVNFTQRYFSRRKIPVEVEFSWGATEAKAAEGLVDAIVEVTETGSTIRAHGLRIVAELMESSPQLIANKKAWQDPWKREKIEQISLLLQGALSAENKVGIKMNVAEKDLDKVIKLIPSITAPTIATLYPAAALKGVKWFSVESVIAEDVVRDLIPRLIQNGAVGIIEYPLNKVI
ncbi:MAG: ATP phosphoribosyltransferase [Deltaproteobacteria bacterium RIFCSPHIGHO2_02_FULL_60_17]|nr:MAG: ATP phosphoribosyltransferase [Deltaproteobacteria bacterium RIFCSPHIGHO2_02_FULL_60_17]OGQ74607.1 MAG: ATP phosphoribosyltransferase [Deltaproteobacteria bacterium RIFCSPLOWO2_12_FULL_60_16]